MLTSERSLRNLVVDAEEDDPAENEDGDGDVRHSSIRRRSTRCGIVLPGFLF